MKLSKKIASSFELSAVSKRSLRLVSRLALGLLPLACGDPLKEPTVLEDVRVLGVQVVTEEGDATLRPGQDGTLRVLIAGPQGPTAARVQLRMCEAVESARGVPACLKQPFFEQISELENEVAFAYSTSREISKDQKWAALGVACQSGTPSLAEDPLDDSCSDDSEALRFSFESHFLGDEHLQNKNPDLSSAKVHAEIDGTSQEVQVSPLGASPSCENAVVLSKGTKTSLLFELPPQAREPNFDETLQVSHFATKGLLERQYTILDPSEPLVVSLTFEAPDEVGPVKHYMVVRDDRGGVEFLSFDLCVN